MTSDPRMDGRKRSLMLASGGLRAAFQAGVLEVWLDEAGLTFHHADGVSSGALNLAMYCQGMNGTQIANNWRKLDAHMGLGFGWPDFLRLIHGRSLGSLDHFRDVVLPAWGFNWDAIRKSYKDATFNVYNFTKHQHRVLCPADMTEEYLFAALGMPVWYPPVTIWGDTYVDAVFATGTNLEEAILNHGADELWVIWTTTDRDDQNEWNDGILAQYFQILETCVNSRFKADVARIQRNNEAIAAGKTGEFGRHIELKVLKAEVPLHYMIDVSSDRLQETVNLGVQAAQTWCKERGFDLKHNGRTYPDPEPDPVTRLSFTEEMKGFVTPGEDNFEVGFKQGRGDKRALKVHLNIRIDDVDRFIVEPEHEAQIEGHVEAECLGGHLPIESGTFNMFVPRRVDAPEHQDPTVSRIVYRLHLRDAQAQPLTLWGYKELADDPGMDIWVDNTTLFTYVLRGHVEPALGEKAEVVAGMAEIVAGGIISIHLLDFMNQLASFRTQGPRLKLRAEALVRFGRLYFGKLWDVYGRKGLPYGPY